MPKLNILKFVVLGLYLDAKNYKQIISEKTSVFFFNIQDQKRLWKWLYVIFWDEMQLIDNINKKLKYDLRTVCYTDSLLLLL